MGGKEGEWWGNVREGGRDGGWVSQGGREEGRENEEERVMYVTTH